MKHPKINEATLRAAVYAHLDPDEVRKAIDELVKEERASRKAYGNAAEWRQVSKEEQEERIAEKKESERVEKLQEELTERLRNIGYRVRNDWNGMISIDVDDIAKAFRHLPVLGKPLHPCRFCSDWYPKEELDEDGWCEDCR